VGSLQVLSNAGDSAAGEMLDYCKQHFFKVAAILTSAGAIGYLITKVFIIPLISTLLEHDTGTVPLIEQTTVGAKLEIMFYELFYSTHGSSSIISNWLTETFNWLFLPLRCALSIPNCLFTAVYNRFVEERFRRDWEYIYRAWKELYSVLTILVLALFEFIIRALNLVGLLLRLVVKLAFDCLVNNTILLIKCLFLFSEFGYNITDKIIDAKAFISRFVDTELARPTKNCFRSLRNHCIDYRLKKKREFGIISAIATTKTIFPEVSHPHHQHQHQHQQHPLAFRPRHLAGTRSATSSSLLRPLSADISLGLSRNPLGFHHHHRSEHAPAHQRTSQQTGYRTHSHTMPAQLQGTHPAAWQGKEPTTPPAATTEMVTPR
jgi:hypothetical protein